MTPDIFCKKKGYFQIRFWDDFQLLTPVTKPVVFNTFFRHFSAQTLGRSNRDLQRNFSRVRGDKECVFWTTCLNIPSDVT